MWYLPTPGLQGLLEKPTVRRVALTTVLGGMRMSSYFKSKLTLSWSTNSSDVLAFLPL